MLDVGLTGGIGSGKSTVARLLAALGAVVIDADELAREAVAPGTPGLAQVVADLGPSVLADDGSLDRQAVAAIVFADPAALARLEAVVHPVVAKLTAQRRAAAAADAVVIHDVPLLAEGRLSDRYDLVVVVDAADAVRLRRLVARGMAPDDARARMAAQAGRTERLAVADVVIRNDGDLAGLESQVEALWRRLSDAVAKRSGRGVGGAT